MVKTASKVLLERKSLILAKMETTYGVDSVPTGSLDAALVSEPDYTVDITVLDRDFVRDDLSPLGKRVGRKLASVSFGMELRSNGRTGSGQLTDAPMLGRFLRACGYSEASMIGTGTIGAVRSAPANTVNPTFAIGGASTTNNKGKYKATVVLGGASATAKVRITGGEILDDTTVLPAEGVSAVVTGTGATVTATVNYTNPLAPTITIGGTFHVGDIITATVNGIIYKLVVTVGMTDLAGIATALAALIDPHALITASAAGAVVTIGYTGTAAGVVVTSGSTALSLGNSGGTITPTWAGSLTLGNSWEVYVYPVGLKYLPVSDNFESITIYLNKDGVLHKLTGAFGTFTIEATAGQYGKITFTFTGIYNTPIDQAAPVSVQESTLPPIVELAKMWLGDAEYKPVVNSFTYDQGNTISPRPDVNSADGYIGIRVVGREPSGGMDPEATLVADYNWWDKLATSTQFALSFRIGQTAGNIVLMNAPKVQYTGMTYQARDGIQTYDAALAFGRDQGNDEFEFCIC